MAKVSSSAGGNWVTINGAHVLIGADGKVSKGPANLMGLKYEGQKTGLTGSQRTAYKKARDNGVSPTDAREHALTYKGSSKKSKTTSGKTQSKSKSNSRTQGNSKGSSSKYPKGIETSQQKKAYTKHFNAFKSIGVFSDAECKRMSTDMVLGK